MVNVVYRDFAQRTQSALFDDGTTGFNASLGRRADKAAATLPATGNQTIFTIAGGRVLISLLFGEVTTIIQAQATTLKVTSAPTVGTAVDLTATLDINGKEAGTLLLVEGDGTALIGLNAGAAYSSMGRAAIIVPVGVVRITTGATSTGATKWQCWWAPLDLGATLV
jgi:hypothetical protein